MVEEKKSGKKKSAATKPCFEWALWLHRPISQIKAQNDANFNEKNNNNTKNIIMSWSFRSWKLQRKNTKNDPIWFENWFRFLVC